MHGKDRPPNHDGADISAESRTVGQGASLRGRLLGCLIAGAVGDALGAPIEFQSIDQIRARYGPQGLRDYAPAFGALGSITDDTQMTVFTIEGLIRAHVRMRTTGNADLVSVLHRAYLRWLYTQGDQVPPVVISGRLITEPGLYAQRAPGHTCLSALSATANGQRYGAVDNPLNDSKGCGGVMRAAPVALWPGTRAEVFQVAVGAAALTHGHPSGYLPAGTLAVIVRELLDGATLDTAIARARSELIRWSGHEETISALDAALTLAREGRPTPETMNTRLGAGWVGEEALAIAICAALSARDLGDGVRLAVNHSGDSDSTGSICGNILGARYGIDAIPSRLRDHVELRWIMEPLIEDALTEFGNDPPVTNSWLARYPPN